MNSAISYLRSHCSPIVKFICIFLFSGAHFLFFFVFLISISSLSHHFSALSLSPSAQHLYLQTHGWQSMTIQITNPLSKSQTHGWFVIDPKSATNHHRSGPRRAKYGSPQWATAPWPLTQSKPTHNHPRNLKPPMAIHDDLDPPTATHSDLNPTHDEPRPPSTHGNLNPTPIWSLQADLEREEKLSLWEKERREHDGSTSGFAGGGNGGGFFFFFFLFLFFLLWLVVVGGCGGCGCGCGGFFLLWFFFLFFLVVVISGRAKISLKGGQD